MVQDGTAQLYQFQFVDKNAKSAIYTSERSQKNKLKSKINLLCALHLYDELKTKTPLWYSNIRSSDFLLINETSNVIGIIWPEKITTNSHHIIKDRETELIKVNCFENHLKIALLYDNQNPRVGNPLVSMPSCKNIRNYAPAYDGRDKLEADAYTFYLDK